MTAEVQLETGFVVGGPRPTETDPAARVDLAERLAGLRGAPGFPDGSDAAVLALSRPRAYTACPNPYGTDLIRSESAPRPDVVPYAADTKVGKGHPVYKAHSYPTKVPHEAIMRFLLHYTEPGDLVLDGFSGSGMTGVAAQACAEPDTAMRSDIEAENPNVKWGARRAFLQDLAPTATFIAAGLNLPVDGAAFDTASSALLARFDRELGWMYRTRTPEGLEVEIDFTVWSEVFTCPHCASEVVFYAEAFDEKTEEVREPFACPRCGASVTKQSLRHRRVPTTTLAGDITERIEMRPVRIFYHLGKKKVSKVPNADDLEVLRRIASLRVTGFPTADLPLSTMGHGSRLAPKGFTKIHHLWGDRALAALGSMWTWAHEEAREDVRSALLFWLEQAFWTMSWMNRYRPEGFSQVAQYQSGVYYIASIHAETSLVYAIGRKRESLIKFWQTNPANPENIRISTGSSESIGLPDESVDYIFVDPPFGANIPYSDLALVIESWHGLTTHAESEATMDSFKHRGLPEYTTLMSRCFAEFARVLRPGRWITVEFSNSDNSVWLGIQQALANAGFVVADTRIFDKEMHSYRQVTATNAVKKDLIISAYKPTSRVTAKIRLSAGSEEGVWEFVREYLRHVEITGVQDGQAVDIRERQVERIFERMLAFHVANGLSVPLSLAEFAATIDEKFNRADAMYFLPDQEETYQRFRLTAPRPTQESAFITNESSAVAWLRRLLEGGRRPFTEIQPGFFKEVQAGLASYERMPELRELLAENFLRDEQDRWFVPDPKDSAQMERLHNQALVRVFETYATGKGPLSTTRSEAIRVGFREAWNEGDYEAIYAVGRRLPQDFFVAETALHHIYRAAERRVART